MNWLINLAGKVTGISALWKKTNGYKVKLGGVAMILLGLANIITAIMGITDTAAALDFIKTIASNPDIYSITVGWLALGFGHKAEKLIDEINKSKEPK